MIILITTHSAPDTGSLATSSARHIGINEVRNFPMFSSFSVLFIFLVTVDYRSCHAVNLRCNSHAQRPLVFPVLWCICQYPLFPWGRQVLCSGVRIYCTSTYSGSKYQVEASKFVCLQYSGLSSHICNHFPAQFFSPHNN